MSSEVVIFRIADDQHLDSLKEGAGKALLDKLVPTVSSNGADYIAFGEIMSKARFGIVTVGWGEPSKDIGK